MRYLLDTNVLSELSKPRPALEVVNWMDSVDSNLVFLSVMTIGEIRKGIERHPDLGRKAYLHSWLDHVMLTQFAGKILPIDLPVALAWGELVGRLQLAGRNPHPVDALIAATAMRNNLILVTRNVTDFEPSGVPILNPWG